jgi:hypothetical protein
MPEYRVFVRDLDNHILSIGFTFSCENDQQALAKTEKLMDGLDLELHEGRRRVARITAPRQSEKGPSDVLQANPASLVVRHEHVQVARDYIRCATVDVTGESDNWQVTQQ